MANTFKFGNKNWAWKEGSVLAYNDENNNFKPLPFDFTRSSSATRVNKDGLIEVVGSDEPRVDYLNNADGHLLLEPSRTNAVLRSQEFDNAAWVKLGQGNASVPIVTPNYAISPDGTQNASRLQCDLNGSTTTNDRSWLYQSISDLVVDNTFSLYVKNISNETTTFSLTNGSSNTVSVPADSQWHRLYTVKTGGTQPRIGLIGGVGASDTADLLIYGAQVEVGSYATSYIPTSGSSVTRAAENQTIQELPNDILGSNFDEGTLYVEMKISQFSITRFISLVSGTSHNSWNGGSSVRMEITPNINASGAYVNAGVGSTGTSISAVGIFDGDVIKMATSWSGTVAITSLNGQSVVGTKPIMTSRPKHLYVDELGTFVGTGNNAGNEFIDIKIYDTALTESQLNALTS